MKLTDEEKALLDQGLRHTEKFYPQLLTREQRAVLDWSFWKDDHMSEGYSNMVKSR
ncbi:MAG TPA: hypothetical protein VMW86_09830 [Dehalococcoidales bacterium]|nr:hypothetical protein [Dehalococcoidales bacterium]